jgi:hypothetical protein
MRPGKLTKAGRFKYPAFCFSIPPGSFFYNGERFPTEQDGAGCHSLIPWKWKWKWYRPRGISLVTYGRQNEISTINVVTAAKRMLSGEELP